MISSRLISLTALAAPGHLRVEACLAQIATRHVLRTLLGLHHQPVFRDVDQPACDFLAVGEPASHPLPERPAELAVLPERPVESGRRNLEIVALGDQVGDIEGVADLTADALDVGERNAPELVDEHSQDAARAVRAPLEIHELESVIAEDGLDHGLDPERTFVL